MTATATYYSETTPVRRAWSITDGPDLDRRANNFLRYCGEKIAGQDILGLSDLELVGNWLERLDADSENQVDFDDLIVSFVVD
jgi:hypothetical protein